MKYSDRTLGDVADFFGVGLDAVKKWRSGPDPMPEKVGNRWPLDEIARWRLGRVLAPKETSEQRELLELRKLSAEVEAKEMALRQKAAALVDRTAAIATITEMFNRVRQRLLAAPEELASALPQSLRSEFVVELKHKMNLILKEFESWSGDVEK